jgi:hypothetical protein
MELIKQRRLNFLVEGSLFNKKIARTGKGAQRNLNTFSISLPATLYIHFI